MNSAKQTVHILSDFAVPVSGLFLGPVSGPFFGPRVKSSVTGLLITTTRFTLWGLFWGQTLGRFLGPLPGNKNNNSGTDEA